MKHTLNNEERNRLDRLTAELEQKTGTQVALAIIERSDAYPELPWKAFALGSSLAGLLVWAMSILAPLPSVSKASLLAVVIMLAAGAGAALLCVFVPDFARLFLHTHRAEAETRQYADALFLSREMFSTKERKAVLLMVSLFERWIVVLPDAGLARQLNPQAAQTMIQCMKPFLKAGQTFQALDAGLKKIEEILQQVPHSQELPNVIEEKGA